MQTGSQVKIPLLLQIDPVFGWTGISFRFPNSWRLTADEVAEHIDQQILKLSCSRAIMRKNRRQQKK
jgi:hypothetical protein